MFKREGFGRYILAVMALTCWFVGCGVPPSAPDPVIRQVREAISEAELLIRVDRDSTLARLQAILQLQQETMLPDSVLSQVYLLKGKCLYFKDSIEASILQFNEAFKRAEAAKSAKLVAKNHLEISKPLLELSDHDAAIFHLKQAIHLLDSLGSSDEGAKARTLLGAIYNELGAYDQAVSELLAGYQVLANGGDPSTLSALCINLSNSYRSIKAEDESLMYLQKALETAREAKDTANMTGALVNIGMWYRHRQPDSAMLFLEQARLLQVRNAPLDNRLSTLYNLGSLNVDIKRYAVASAYFDSVLNASVALSLPRGKAMALAGKAGVAIETGRRDQADVWIAEALEITKALGYKDLELQLTELRHDAAQRSGNYTTALQTLHEQMRLKDSIALLSKAEAIYSLSRKHEARDRDQAISRLQAESALQQRVIRANRLFIAAALALAALLGLFAFVYARLSRSRRDAYRELLNRYEQSRAVQAQQSSHQPFTLTEGESGESIQLVRRLHTLFRTDHLYKDPDLRVDQLAYLLGVPYKTLNSAVKELEQVNISTLINRYRVEAVIDMFKNPEFDAIKTQFIARQAGFGSVSTFYTVFQEITGLQPSQYRKMLAAKDT
jgi:AraC-like DNA-binding protein